MKIQKFTLMKIVATIGAISLILYGLADRYLIDHVEISNVSELYAATTNTTTSTSTENASEATVVESTSPETSVSQTSEASTSTESGDSIESASTQAATSTEIADPIITISQVEVGSGSNKVTYYVADVILGDASQLTAAFADDAFGNNIIDYTSSIAEDNNAIFAINGDYYGFRDDGIIIRNGVIFRDDGVRTGLAIYYDGTMKVYDETTTTAAQLIADGAMHTYSFGPGLVTDGEIIAGIDDVEVDTNFGNHSIQGNQPRTAIGMIDTNHFVFVVVDGRSNGYSVGMDINELADLMLSLGCTEAYNLDGGGSSTMVYDDELVNNPLGRNKERGTSDILMIGGTL